MCPQRILQQIPPIVLIQPLFWMRMSSCAGEEAAERRAPDDRSVLWVKAQLLERACSQLPILASACDQPVETTNRA